MLSRDIAACLSKENKVTVLCPKPSRPEGFLFEKSVHAENYKVQRLDSFTCPSSNLPRRLRESYSFGIHCARYIKKHSNEIGGIYINSWPLFSQYLIIKSSKKRNIPTILHVQDIYPESLTEKLPHYLRKVTISLLLPLDTYILKNATRVIGISRNMISYLSKTRRIDPMKFELIRNWQNDDVFLNEARNADMGKKEEFIFMYVGSLSASAGVDVIVRGFHDAKMPSSKLIIAGSGADKQKCMALANDLKNRQIEFCEAKPEDVPELQSQADVLLLPLKIGIGKTATPSKLTAYLLSSRPVLACVEDETDVGNILREGNCGFVVEPENPSALSFKMQELYDMNPKQLEQLGKNGRKYALKNLSKKANLQRIVSIIESLI